MSNNNVLGTNIRNKRRQRGMTQATLADLAGVNRLTISRYEKGTLRPSEKVLNKIARALETQAIELMYDFEYDYESTAAIQRFITDLETWKLMVSTATKDENGRFSLGINQNGETINLKLSEDELNAAIESAYEYFYYLLKKYEV